MFITLIILFSVGPFDEINFIRVEKVLSVYWGAQNVSTENLYLIIFFFCVYINSFGKSLIRILYERTCSANDHDIIAR